MIVHAGSLSRCHSLLGHLNRCIDTMDILNRDTVEVISNICEFPILQCGL